MDDNLEVVEPSDYAEPIGDTEINLTINGKSMDGLDAEGEDVPELRKNNIDYTKYDDLIDLFTVGIQNFCYFISRSVPPELSQDYEGDDLDLYSSRQGILALRKCIDLLKKQLNTGETGYEKQDDYDTLSDWYVDGIIDFMSLTLADVDTVPEDMLKEDDDNYPIECAIKALNKVRKMLLANVKEAMNVK